LYSKANYALLDVCFLEILYDLWNYLHYSKCNGLSVIIYEKEYSLAPFIIIETAAVAPSPNSQEEKRLETQINKLN